MIEGLHEITLPAPVSYVPQTIGWLVVAVLALAMALWICVRLARHRKANRYRGVALEQLTVLEQELETAGRRTALTAIPLLVKRVTLEAYPRKDVASLSGDAWLNFLDASYGGTGFTEGSGRLLPLLSYTPPKCFEGFRKNEVSELTVLIRQWIKKHH